MERARRRMDADLRAHHDLVVDVLGLGDRLEHRPSELSGGQQQRVAIAGALVTRPAIVFADELTGNLDSESSAEVLGFLRRSVRELGQTVVMVTHELDAAAYADDVIVIADGQVRAHLVQPSSDERLAQLRKGAGDEDGAPRVAARPRAEVRRGGGRWSRTAGSPPGRARPSSM